MSKNKDPEILSESSTKTEDPQAAQTKASPKKQKRRRGDRRDGRFIRNADTMHKFMPFLLPNRTDNEAMMIERVEMTAVEEYVKKKNEETHDEFKYTMFHVICAAIAKIMYLRPKMNYFYEGHRLYERNEISLSFTVKKKFEDHSDESLAIIKVDKESDVSPLEQIHGKIKDFLAIVRGNDGQDGTTDILDTIVKFPRPIVRLIVWFLNKLEYHDMMPKGLVEFDPYHSSVFVSNTGSIKLSANYHHLTNWGTNSFFALIGERKPMPFYDENGNVTMKLAVDFALTVDERIADGYYFSKTIRLLRYLMAHPEELDKPIATEVDFDN